MDPKDPDNPFADYTRKQLYEFISDFELSRDIDSRWQYSNVGYSLLGDILSITGNKSFDQLVTERICMPLNMKNTSFIIPEKLRANAATGHSEYGQPAGAWDFILAGGGGLRSNVNDMLSFAEANLGLVKTDLLPSMELTHILQAKKDGNDTYTTMGWTHDGNNIVFKDGGTGGYRTFLGIDKKNKIGVVVLSNSNNSVTDIGRHILDPMHIVEPYKYPWSLLDTLRTTVYTKGVDAAIELYQHLKASKNLSFIFNEYQLNYLGSELRRAQRINEAIKIYELNVNEYPKSMLVYESLGEMYKKNKEDDRAIRCFEEAMQLEPNNPHWSYLLEKLKRVRKNDNN